MMSEPDLNVSQKAALSLFSGDSGKDPFSLIKQLRDTGPVIPVSLPMGVQIAGSGWSHEWKKRHKYSKIMPTSR